MSESQTTALAAIQASIDSLEADEQTLATAVTNLIAANTAASAQIATLTATIAAGAQLDPTAVLASLAQVDATVKAASTAAIAAVTPVVVPPAS